MTILKKQIAESIFDLIVRAKSGDTEAAYILLEDFAMVVKAGGIPDQVSLDYIAECFTEILNQAKPEEALNIPYPDNKPPKPHSDLEDIAIAEKVIWEVRKNMLETGLGLLTKAKESIAERMDISRDRVDKAYRTHKKAAKRIVGLRLQTPKNEQKVSE
jgi:hypothetical protein